MKQKPMTAEQKRVFDAAIFWYDNYTTRKYLSAIVRLITACAVARKKGKA